MADRPVPMALVISSGIRDAIVAHARAEHPREACGIVAGPAGSGRAERFIPMTNAEQSSTFYRMDTAEQLAVWRDMDDRGEEPVIVYHSHTASQAYPSRADVAFAFEPDAHYVIVSTRDTDGRGEFQFRSFRIADGTVTEETVVEAP